MTLASPFSPDPHRSHPTSRLAPSRLLAAAILVGILPLVALVALAIAASGQKPLFLQERVGRDRALFRIVKFRTLPEGGWEAAYARASRIERRRLTAFRAISRILRASGLDELPQLFNVVRGDMDFIGPRPLTPEDFAALPSGRERRCAVRPGITGLAQVHGGQRLGAREKLLLDLYFIEHVSWAMRTRIVWRSALRLSGFNHVVETIDARLLDRAGAAVAHMIENPAAQAPYPVLATVAASP